MASGKSIVRQISWISFIPQIAFVSAIIFTLQALGIQEPIMKAAVIYLIVSIGLRYIVPSHHRQGITAFRRGDYQSALSYFEKSYDFFKKYNWIDRWRYLVLFSSSRMSYREMALINIAFCYGQTNRGSESKAAYERALKEFPDSQMAMAALNMFSSMSGDTGKET